VVAVAAAKGLHLLKRLREVNDTVLKGRLTGLVAEMSLLAGSLAAETSLRELKDSVALLARDLALSPTGRFAIKPHMWSQYAHSLPRPLSLWCYTHTHTHTLALVREMGWA
jgi:hypothetical protein